MRKYTNIMKEPPPARTPIDVIFDDNVTRRMVYNDNLDCLQPVALWERGYISQDAIVETHTLTALAWRKVFEEE